MKAGFLFLVCVVLGGAVPLDAQPAIYSEAPFNSAQGERGPGVPALWVRPGYRVELVADNVGEARFMAFDDTGRLYLSRPARSDILVFQRQADGTYKQQATFVDKLPSVQGMCWENGWMWFAQTGAIYKGRDTNGDGRADEVIAVIPEGKLPKGGGHYWRSLLVTRDAIFTSIGDTGNITDEMNTERQKIFRFNKDGTGKKLWASGLRNTEKLRLRPGTQEIWGSDHGSDNFGNRLGEEDTEAVTDFNPPDELNHYVEGAFYGHPFITGLRMPRPEYFDRPDLMALAAKTTPPDWCFGAHWSANAIEFLEKAGPFSADHAGDAVVACRGSWNRSTPGGYRVERVLFDKVTGKPYGSLMLVGTLGVDRKPLARPADCVQEPDGAILFTDNFRQRIYRITAARE